MPIINKYALTHIRGPSVRLRIHGYLGLRPPDSGAGDDAGRESGLVAQVAWSDPLAVDTCGWMVLGCGRDCAICVWNERSDGTANRCIPASGKRTCPRHRVRVRPRDCDGASSTAEHNRRLARQLEC